MLRPSNKTSIFISMVMTGLLTLTLIVLLPFLPAVVDSMLGVKDNVGNRELLGEGARLYVLVAAYVMMAVAFVTVAFLFLLLRQVWQGRVFEKSVLRILTVLSLCCFIMGALFLSIVYCFQIALLVSLAAFFLGLCLRVVKNVLAEAGRIKAENDFTI